jgi:hypothetical protein
VRERAWASAEARAARVSSASESAWRVARAVRAGFTAFDWRWDEGRPFDAARGFCAAFAEDERRDEDCGFDAELREDVEEARAGLSPLRDVRRWFAEEAPERFSAEERERDDEDFLACSKSTICACLLT